MLYVNIFNNESLSNTTERKISLIMKDLNERIRDLRKEHHLRQHEVADYLGVTQQTYSNYENGQCKLISGGDIHVFDNDGKEIETYPCPRSHYDDDYDSGYSQEDLDDMYKAAFEGDPSAQWNID